MTAPKTPRIRKQKTRVEARGAVVDTPRDNGRSLRLALKQADLLQRRAGQGFLEAATELQEARVKRQEAERKLASFYAKQSTQAGRPFFNFLAQGDSWFDYTCGNAIVPWLTTIVGPQNAYFENLASSGRKLRQMLSQNFKDRLVAGAPNGVPWNGVLVSGGGNDICGDHHFADWLQPYDGGANPPDYYIHPNFFRELDILKGLYIDIIEFVRKTAKGLKVFAHDYDYAIPDNRCVTGKSPHLRSQLRFCWTDTWLWPAFEQRGFHPPNSPHVPQLTCDVVVAILKRFAEMLVDLEHAHPNLFYVVRTQGVLQPIQSTSRWVNELHPYDDAFEMLATTFHEKLRKEIGVC